MLINCKDGKTVAEIAADADGMGGFGVHKDGKTVAVISATTDGGVLGVSNKDGKPVAGFSAYADGNGVMHTFDSKGEITSEIP